ncbi:hypothetical protein [Alkalilimnicola sp. S0819]|uniref:hypothetical protein n=1 Tax=Alkalilimnicola sp. S0819 TaxID=2613922 RepID=UPI00126208C3|nr:hypothetical protein [Alkalilimnicola sp. S0819]KAB7619385.1 hypothetical protein F3N43_13880 [Alkalilimnicola sp. S0819]MPQ17723.1 hypothetical protein [Alkalilimnicola sp. S0819]
MSKKIEHNGNTFEIRCATFEDRYAVGVFLNDSQVSPEYSAKIDVAQDYFSQHKQRILDALIEIAESDIRNDMYFKA